MTDILNRLLLPALLLVTTGAFADTLELLGPSSAVPAEGFSIALLRRDGTGAPVALAAPRVSATGAEVRPGPEQPLLRTFLVLPRAGVREVRVHAEAQGLEAEARYVLGPPATQVSIALEPAAPVKGRDTEARLTVRMVQPDGTPDDSGAPPVLRASVGQVEGLERTGPGTWQARYVLPQTRYPEVAILVALSAWPHPQSIHGAFGAVRVPLAASVDLPGDSDPQASVSLEVAGKTFGPVRTGPDGRFRLPIIVPPGHRFALVRAVDDDGNARRTRLDMKVPPTDRLACVLNPQRLPADGASRARLLCATSDVYGAPTEESRVKAQARHGTLRGPTRTEDGLLEWVYTAPSHLPATPEELVANSTEKGSRSSEELALQLVQGPAAQASLSLSRPMVYRGQRVAVSVSVKDAFGKPRPEAGLALEATVGSFAPPREEAPGVFSSTWDVPQGDKPGEAVVTARAYGPSGTEPARLRVWRSAAEGNVLYAGVTDLAGQPVPGQPLRVGKQALVTGADGTVVVGPLRPGSLEVVHGQWPGLRQTVHLVGVQGPFFPEEPPMNPPPLRQRVLLAPSVEVVVQLEVEGRRVTYWLEDLTGKVLEDRAMHVALSAGERGPVQVRQGKSSFTVAHEGPVSVSVADVKTGITAVAEVRP